jgi:Cu(I)/Ag(I) efflux system membrane fusion protein
MSSKQSTFKGFLGFIPRQGRGLIGLIIVIVVAFSLGNFFSGDDSMPSEEAVDHDHSGEAASESTMWTCSMHPQIKLPKFGKCPICFMDLIPLDSDDGDDLGPSQLRMSETAMKLAQIETAPVRRAFAEAEVRMVGKIAYDETNVAYITAWVPGRLDRLYADYTGMTVNEGDHMVYMYSPELLASQEELLQAKSAVSALSKTSSTVLRSTAEATIVAAREKLRLFGLTEDQIMEIEETEKPSDHITIYAPIGGVVVHKDAMEGMYVKTGTRIYTIADLSKLWVFFDAYESDLPWLRYGQQVTFSTTSYPGETFEAVISFIDPIVDPKKRTVRVRGIVENTNGRLKPDMFVSGVVKSQVDDQGKVVDAYLAGKWISPMHPEIVKDGPGACDICGLPQIRRTHGIRR